MRVVLISVINSYKYGNTGVDYIAQYLREKNNDVVDIKYYHNNESFEEIIQDIEGYDIYGFSVFETNFQLFVKLAQYIKKNRNCIIVFGGQFITMNYQEILLQYNNIDYCIIGDGESPMKRIIDHHKAIEELLLGDMNIATSKDMMSKKSNIEIDINRNSSYDYFKNDTREKNSQKTHCILTKSNICVGACTFCCSRKGVVSYKTNERILREIEMLAREYNVKKFFFCDDDIFDVDSDENRDRLSDLFDKIDQMKLNIIFSGFSKSKSVCNIKNRFLLNKMNKVGFHHLFIGVDAGNEEDRILYNKQSSLLENIKAVEILRRVGVSPRFGMIFINPYSTLERFRDSYRYLLKLKSSNFYHYGGLRVQLLNGTKLLDMVKNDGLLLRDYSFVNTQKYTFRDPDVVPIAEFLENNLIPLADNVKNQFNTLKKKYEMVRHISIKAEKYKDIVNYYEQREFEAIKEYFYHLYEENALLYCKEHLNEFIENMVTNSQIYRPIILELDNIFMDTPIDKGGRGDVPN